MGSSSSVPALAEAEKKLLSWGIDWYERWEAENGDGAVYNLPSCSFVTGNVPVSGTSTGQGDGHIHQARYFRGAEHARAEAEQAEQQGPPLVCLHGFGTGIGQFATALPAIRCSWKGPLFALDLFGCSMSSRPPWTMGFGAIVDLDKVEQYFIDPIESWRKAMGLKKVVLLGHSIGGYLAACYALRYPDSVDRLILVSPVGIPQKSAEAELRLANATGRWKLFLSLWDAGWSPFTAVKIIGRFAMNKYVANRYKDASWTPKELLAEYLYLNWTSAGNSGGGYVQNTLLQPGAWARRPLCDRFPNMKVPRISFIFGTRDWMDSQNAEMVGAQNVAVEMVKVADGGHNMMVDNPLGFAEAVTSTGSGPPYGHQFGNKPLLIESGRSFEMGQRVKAQRGSRRDWVWQVAKIVSDNGDGTFDLQWEDASATSLRQGGYTIRHIDEDVSNEHHVHF